MNKQKKTTIILFLLVPLLGLVLFTYFPFVKVIINSFFSMSYTKNEGFVFFDNYTTILTNTEYNSAIFTSVYYMIAALVQVFISLIFALLLCRCKLSGFYKAVLVLPYILNGIAVGYIFRLFYTHGYVLDSVLQILGAESECLPYWLRDQNTNNWALAFASVWRYSGLSLITFIGAIGAIDKTLFEASSLDGANEIQQYRYIIWPNIKTVVYLNLLLSIVTSLSEFELPYAIASGGANGTATYMTLIYRIAFTERKIGLASAMAVILLLQIILFVLIIVQITKIRKQPHPYK